VEKGKKIYGGSKNIGHFWLEFHVSKIESRAMLQILIKTTELKQLSQVTILQRWHH
jgi:hypothetical protein